MTEQEILGDQCLTVAYGRTEKPEQKKEILEHRLNIMPLSARSRPGRLLHPNNHEAPITSPVYVGTRRSTTAAVAEGRTLQPGRA